MTTSHLASTPEAKTKIAVPVWLRAAIQDELRRYPITRIVVRERRQEIIDETPHLERTDYMTQGVMEALKERQIPVGTGLRTSQSDPIPASRNSHISDPTFAKVARLSSKDIVQMEWVTQAISDVYSMSSDERQSIIDLYYWRKQPHYQVADRLGMSESTLWRMRQDIIQDIAYRMGVLKPSWKWFRNAQRKGPKQREGILKGSGQKTVL